MHVVAGVGRKAALGQRRYNLALHVGFCVAHAMTHNNLTATPCGAAGSDPVEGVVSMRSFPDSFQGGDAGFEAFGFDHATLYLDHISNSLCLVRRNLTLRHRGYD